MAGSDHWNTPQWIVDLLVEFNGKRIELDPCSNARSCTNAEIQWFGPPGVNGLVMPWTINGLVFVNPPYSDKAAWMQKCYGEQISCDGNMDVIALIPADTDTNHWHRYCVPAVRKCFLRGRVVHTGVKKKPLPARFPSVLIYWGGRDGIWDRWHRDRVDRFEKVFVPHGWVV